MIRAPLVSRRAYDLALKQLDAAELRCAELHELVKSLARPGPSGVVTVEPRTVGDSGQPSSLDTDLHPDILDVMGNYGRPGTEVWRQLSAFARAQRASGQSPEQIIAGIRNGGATEDFEDEPLEIGVGA